LDERRYPLQERAPRLAAVLAVAAGVVLLWRHDAVAGGVALVGLAALAGLITRRGRGALGRTIVAVGAGATALAVVSAIGIAVPVRPVRPQGPLLVAPPDSPAAPGAPGAPGGPSATVLGFVTPDYGDAAAVIDRDGALVSSVAATGITLGSQPGSIAVRPPGDVLARAHLHGAAGLAVVSNYDGTGFNGGRAAAVLASSSGRRRLVSASPPPPGPSTRRWSPT